MQSSRGLFAITRRTLLVAGSLTTYQCTRPSRPMDTYAAALTARGCLVADTRGALKINMVSPVFIMTPVRVESPGEMRLIPPLDPSVTHMFFVEMALNCLLIVEAGRSSLHFMRQPMCDVLTVGVLSLFETHTEDWGNLRVPLRPRPRASPQGSLANGHTLSTRER